MWCSKSRFRGFNVPDPGEQKCSYAVYLYSQFKLGATQKLKNLEQSFEQRDGVYPVMASSEHFVREIAAFENRFANPLSGERRKVEHGAALLSWANPLLLAFKITFEPRVQFL